jgi:hypothetical protein
MFPLAFREPSWYNVKQRYQIAQFVQNRRLKLAHGGTNVENHLIL